MLTRISIQLPINIRGMWVGTFHGLCNRFLRKHHVDANLPETFQILDSADQKSAIKRVMKTIGIDEDLISSKEAMYFINNNKEEGVRSQQLKPMMMYLKNSILFMQPTMSNVRKKV